ncbi:hypothetical protein ACHAW5_002238 [Stephanodiscus triporus]|uniref:Uncharacterized protein n=1 Tax=Stephanodiscus triporus TaxID=2934178 RepID=A0ABD3QLS3_9STRA
MRNCEVAKENAASARANLDGSREEVRAAEALLKEAMARFENVNGVEDVEVMSDESASSKQKMNSITPWGNNNCGSYYGPYKMNQNDGFDKTVKTGEWQGKNVKYIYNRGKLHMSIEEVTGIEALMKEAEEMRAKDAMSAPAPPKQRRVSVSPTTSFHSVSSTMSVNTDISQINDTALDTVAAAATTFAGEEMATVEASIKTRDGEDGEEETAVSKEQIKNTIATTTATPAISNGFNAIYAGDAAHAIDAADAFEASYDCAPSGSLVVEGCGLSELNGIFTKDESQSDGSPKYVKQGTWKGKNVEYNVCRDKSGCWWFSVVDGNKVNLYHIRAPRTREAPPENHWKVCAGGVSPAPSCRVVA